MREIDSEPDGLCTIEGEFYTEHFVVRGELISTDVRLSDHLNSATAMLELRPSLVQRSRAGLRVNLSGGLAYIAKERVLFVIPVSEPKCSDGQDGSDHTETITHTCWAGLGPFSILGDVHMEASLDPRLFLRSLQHRRFLPFTDSRVTFPDGSVKEYVTVIVNRSHVELLALQPERPVSSAGAKDTAILPDEVTALRR